MKSIIIKMGLSLVTASVLFSGCGTSVLPPKQIPITKQSEIKVLTVKATDVDEKKINQDTILHKIGKQISEGSEYIEKARRRACPTCTIYEMKGVESTYTKQQFELIYVNGKDYSTGMYEAKDIFKFPVKSELDSSTNTYKLSVSYPKEVTTYSVQADPGLGIPQLDPLPKLEKDALSVFNNLKNLKIELKAKIAGEINTQYSDASIYANFERILRVYDWKGNKPSNLDIAKEKYFSFNLKNGKTVPLHIKIYPYQNGSKIVYDLEVPYILDMNGGINMTLADIHAIKDEITKIANN